MMPYHGFQFIYGEYVNLNNASFSAILPLRATEKVINIESCVCGAVAKTPMTSATTTTTRTEHNAANPKP